VEVRPISDKKNKIKKTFKKRERRNHKRVRPDAETPEIATAGAARFPPGRPKRTGVLREERRKTIIERTRVHIG